MGFSSFYYKNQRNTVQPAGRTGRQSYHREHGPTGITSMSQSDHIISEISLHGSAAVEYPPGLNPVRNCAIQVLTYYGKWLFLAFEEHRFDPQLPRVGCPPHFPSYFTVSEMVNPACGVYSLAVRYTYL